MTRHVALVGGAGGIGRALAAEAAETGWRVTVLDLPSSLDRHPPTVAAHPLDLTEPETVSAAFEAVGPCDGVVNLAGFMTAVEPLIETGLDAFDDVHAGNYRGAYLVAKAAYTALRAAGAQASMVQVSSGLAANVRPGYGLYGANKAAILHLTKTCALEWAPEIRVNAVAPAAVDTAFLRGGTGRSDEDRPTSLDRDAYAAATPLGRLATPEDITGPILFLLGPGSAFMTGQVLWVNGGIYMP